MMSTPDCFRLERELGQGGMATVYLVHNLKHDRKVTLKVLRSELAAVQKGRIDGESIGRWDGLDFSHADLPP
jgi:serine/threonine protein kinase